MHTTYEQPPSATFYSPHRPRGGGRVASDKYRRAIEFSESFAGLDEGTSRFDLLLLAKRAGGEAGFTPKMIQLLEYYLTVLTRDVDWEEGRPIVYQGLSKTALELGVSERQIQKLEKSLFEVGALGYIDSGNCRRYGQRDQATGRIEYAFGPDLSPLAAMQSQLEEIVRQKEEYTRAWHGLKRQISAARRQIRSLLLEWHERGGEGAQIATFEKQYNEIAIQLRTHIDLAAMQSLLNRHNSLLEAIAIVMGVETTSDEQSTQRATIAEKTTKCSSPSAPKFVHYKYNNQDLNICSRSDAGFQENVAETPVPQPTASSCGVQHITLQQVRRAASDRLRTLLPLNLNESTWSDVIEAAFRLRSELGVSQASWGEACGVMGRSGAAVCLLVTDRAALREENRVRQPAAYFRGMVKRARGGELHLHRSIFGLLEQQSQQIGERAGELESQCA